MRLEYKAKNNIYQTEIGEESPKFWVSVKKKSLLNQITERYHRCIQLCKVWKIMDRSDQIKYESNSFSVRNVALPERNPFIWTNSDMILTYSSI